MSDESLFREVDEEVRREQEAVGPLRNPARRGQPAGDHRGCRLEGVAILGVEPFPGCREDLFRARVGGQGRDNELQELAKSGPSGYALLARFSLAGELAKAGKRDEALKAYEAIAGDGSVPQAFREAATIRAAYLLADTASAADPLGAARPGTSQTRCGACRSARSMRSPGARSGMRTPSSSPARLQPILPRRRGCGSGLRSWRRCSSR